MHKILFYNKFIICLYMFRAQCAHHQEVKIVLYNISYHHTCRWPSRVLSRLITKIIRRCTVSKTSKQVHDNTRYLTQSISARVFITSYIQYTGNCVCSGYCKHATARTVSSCCIFSTQFSHCVYFTDRKQR